MHPVPKTVDTDRTQSYGGRSKTNEPAISSVGLVDGVCIFVAELVHDSRYPVVVLCLKSIPYQTLELERTALSLVVELIIQRLGDVDVHVEERGKGLYMLRRETKRVRLDPLLRFVLRLRRAGRIV